MRTEIKKILIFVGIAIIVLWQLLKPGYVLTLDMTFGPQMDYIKSATSILSSAPLWYALDYSSRIVPAWIIQKIILFGLFFLMGYLPYKYIARLWSSSDKESSDYAAFFVAIFYICNPFVYERFLAGHWTHLFAYTFIPALAYHFYQFFKQPNWKDIGWGAIWLLLISIFSLHFLVMSIILLLFCYIVILLGSLKNVKLVGKYLKYGIVAGVAFIIASLYWLIPLFNGQGTGAIENFGQANWNAFMTASDKYFGVAGNVALLYGFWGESYAWAKYWLWPNSHLSFYVIFLIIFGLIILGVIRSWNKSRVTTIVFLFLCFLAFMFSCGIGDTLFKPINLWLFEHVSFWRGFRDTQKWSGWLVFGYAYFSGWGVIWLSCFLEKIKLKKDWLLLLIAVPIFYTYTLPGGFARQIQSVWYPESWQEAKEIINSDLGDSKILYLPWHGYLTLAFNNKILVSNPARKFFGPSTAQGQNMELGTIYSQNIPEFSQSIENLIVNQDEDGIIDFLYKNNFKYIVFSHDLIGVDNLDYSFLGSGELMPILEEKDLTLYKIVLK